MPEPLSGRVVLTEFVDPLEAQVALAALTAHGIDARLMRDRHGIGDGVQLLDRPGPIIELIVLEEDSLLAWKVLDEIDDDLPAEFGSDAVEEWSAGVEDRARARRERVRRRAIAVIVVLFVVVVVALLVGAVLAVRA